MRVLVCLLAVVPLFAQAPRVGEIDYYGIRKVSREKIRAAVGIRPGDPLPPSKGDVEDRLEKLPNVVEARLEAVCCDEGKAALFVGIEERGAAHFALRTAPAGNAVLPEEIVSKYRDFLAAVESAARRGSTAEDLTQGHSLMADPAAREIQQQFAEFTTKNLALVRSVLRDAAEPEQRAVAAAIAGYAPDKRKVIDDLLYAMQDPDERVRANAMRALGAIAVLAAKQPALELKIPPIWFVEMLNSIALSDRMKAANALVALTDHDAAETLELIRERALPAVMEMARWKNLRYALPAFILAGRLASLNEQQIEDAWSGGRREQVIESLARRGKR